MYTPKKLYWEDKLKTGDENLDFQHKYLFETFNKLGDAITAEQSKDTLNTILSRLKFYAEWHFGKEEECMERYNCPVAEQNKKAHAKFLDMFAQYRDESQQPGNTMEVAIKIHESLSDWLLNHVLGVDTRLQPCIHK